MRADDASELSEDGNALSYFGWMNVFSNFSSRNPCQRSFPALNLICIFALAYVLQGGISIWKKTIKKKKSPRMIWERKE